MPTNRSKILVELLAVDAWHNKFSADKVTSPVHVELSFRNGRIGDGDDEFPFTFRISLKKARLTIKVEEPLQIDRNSIARHIPIDQTEKTTITTIRESIKKDKSLGGKIDPASFAVAFNVARGSAREITKEEQVKATQAFPRLIVTPIPVARGEYCWEIIPSNTASLDGQPWNPTTEPRLHVKNFKVDAKVDPSIKVLVSCAVEDLIIDELIPKKDGLYDRLREYVVNEVNYKAAIQHLKKVLLQTDIEVGQISSQFSDLIIADILASEE